MENSPQQLKKQAEAAYQSKQYRQAAELFLSASQAFSNAGNLLAAAEMSSNRSVSLLQAGDAKGALEAVRGMDRVFSLSGDTRKQALALGNEAAALEALGKHADAMDKYRQAADLLKQIGDSESRAAVLKSISQIQLKTGRHLESFASMDAALENQKKLSLIDRLLKKLLQVPFSMLHRG